ncbi:unnamed protein product [Ectocarpus sp. 13 AM-2016]
MKTMPSVSSGTLLFVLSNHNTHNTRFRERATEALSYPTTWRALVGYPSLSLTSAHARPRPHENTPTLRTCYTFTVLPDTHAICTQGDVIKTCASDCAQP